LGASFVSFGSFDALPSPRETARCNGQVNMRVTITTDGGFTGRGIGSASAEVDDDLLRDAEAWAAGYTARRGADLVRYTMTFGGRSVSWTDAAEIPEDLRRVFEKVWVQPSDRRRPGG
jgi:hypothetical protein